MRGADIVVVRVVGRGEEITDAATMFPAIDVGIGAVIGQDRRIAALADRTMDQIAAGAVELGKIGGVPVDARVAVEPSE